MELARFAPAAGDVVGRSAALPRAAADLVPLNLAEQVPASTLLVWLREAIDSLHWEHPQVISYLRQHPEYRPKTLLSLLCFGCSTGVFGCAEIVANCRADQDFRALCGATQPFPFELARFRRKNRALLIEVLARVFLRYFRHRKATGPETDLAKAARELALSRLATARHMDAGDE